MYRYSQPFLALPGKSNADLMAIADYFNEHPDEYRESRRAAGVTLERAYLQTTPMGTFVVAYIESERDSGTTFAALADPSTPLQKRFGELVKELHGVDITAPPPGPPAETIGDWRDDRVTGIRNGFAFCAPLLPGTADGGRAFIHEAFVTRRAELEASRRGWNHNAEVVTLHSTPMGDVVAVYLEGEDPVEGNRRFAASSAPFDRWFKDELKKLFPPQVDFDQPVPGVEGFFDSQKLHL